jgi:hypothetical protein
MRSTLCWDFTQRRIPKQRRFIYLFIFLFIYLFLWDFKLGMQCQNYDTLGQGSLYLARRVPNRRPEDNTGIHSRFTNGRS